MAEVSPTDLLVPVVGLLGVGAATALASRALRISPIVGYLVAGVLVGPYALGLINESEMTHLLAELGVVLLLFDIGMHISLRELRQSRQDLLGLAPAHMAVNALGFTLVLAALGANWPVAIAIGVSLALSSTAVVARILHDRGLNSCPLGRSATHVLIFQDIVAIFLLIFANALGGDPGSIPLTMALAAGQAVIAFGVAWAAGRFVLGHVLKLLAGARNSEAFTAATLLLALGAALATYQIGLSLTLGAFLAGLAVSGTAYRHQIQSESGPFRGLLLSFFFINVGMMLDIGALGRNFAIILAAAALILLSKTAAGYLAARLNKWTVPGATQLAFLLAQGSEFTLVVLSILGTASNRLAANGGAPLFDPELETIIVASVALSLAAAPFWADAGMRLSRHLARRLAVSSDDATAGAGGPAPVIVYGMTKAGRLAVDALRDFSIPLIALDNDPERFLAATADGYTVSFGDAANMRLIEAIGATNARAVVIGQPRYSVSADLTPTIQRDYPVMKRFVAVDEEADVQRFKALGMSAHHAAAEPAGIEMVAEMLRHLGVEKDKLVEWMQKEADRFDVDDRSGEIVGDLKDEAQAA